MSMTQTTASGARLTMVSEKGDGLVTRSQADTWLRLRQAARKATITRQRLAS